MSESAIDNFDPSKHADVLLMSHVLQKGIQAGSVLGLVLAPVISSFRHRTLRIGLKTLARGSFTGAVVGFIGSGALGAAKMSQLDQTGIEDRVYRLHYNQGQNRVDSLSVIGAGTGSIFGALLLRSNLGLIRGIGGGAALGVATGVLIHNVTYKTDKKENLMLKEL